MWASFFRKYRTDSLYLAGVLLVTAALLGLMLNRFLTVVNHDSAIFCILAQSLLHGNYMLVSEPNPQPYFTFPPFLSLQLAGLMRLFHNTDIQAMQPVFKGYINVLFLVNLPLFYVWIRQMLGRMPAMVLTALVAVNPIIFKYSSDVLSDVPYWVTSMGALFAAWRFQEAYSSTKLPEEHTETTTSSMKSTGYPWRWYGLAVLLIILSALTRQIGMALVLAFLVSLGLKKQWKLLLLSVLLFSGTVGAWQGYEHVYRLHHRSDIDSLNQQGVQEVLDKSPIKLEYVKHFLIDRPVDMDQNRLQTSPLILLGNIRDRIVRYTEMSIDQLLPELNIRQSGHKHNIFHMFPFYLLLWALFFPGLWRMVRRYPFAGLYTALYMAVLLVYPYITPRFLLPVFPLILTCIFIALLGFKEWLTAKTILPTPRPALQKAACAVVPVFVLLALVAQLPDTIRWVNAGYRLKEADQGPSLRKGNAAYYHTLLWLKANTPANSLVISRKPPVTYFYSGRRSTAFPFTAHADKLFSYIEEKKTHYGQEYPFIYVFEDNVFGSSTRYLKPTVEKYRANLQLVYTEPLTQSRVWLLR
jgi:hypothetical protein